jgi:hypothetical protein
MPSQFAKRKIKEKEMQEEEIVAVESLPEVAPTLTHVGYDIFLGPDNRSYQVVTFSYNPETQQVMIENIKPISRQVALTYENQKRALTTLMKY